MKKLLLVATLLISIFTLAACGKDAKVEIKKYTVSFVTDGGTVIDSQEITEGGLVDEPTTPLKEGYVFDGAWLHGTEEWNFDIDIVTENVTLTAGWIYISSTPTNIEMTAEAFSSNVTWTQTDAALQTFKVYAKLEGGASFNEVAGEITVEAGAVLDVVTFTPSNLIGGYYTIKVVAGVEEAVSDVLLFGGMGTESNPYLTSKIADINAILDGVVAPNNHFLQVNDILQTLEETIEINNSRKVVFSGVYDGANFKLSFGGNGGLFHEITEQGIVKNIVIDETGQVSASEDNLYAVGALANINNGLIENISTRAKVVNSRLQGELPVFDGTVDTTDTTTGAGAIVGTNGLTGIIKDVHVGGSGTVKAGRGIGGVAAYNYGTISGATITATLGAGNQSNSGKSSNNYSFGGGIAGFNFGIIKESVVSGRVFAQSAISDAAVGNEAKNVVFGGIVGYNEGTITEVSFSRNLDMKEFIDKTRSGELEDKASNLGVASVHADLYVGGIAGINAGDINNVYVGGALIGGRDFVGGITGKSMPNATITNSYVFAEIAIKDEAGVKVTAATALTTLTTYEIAPGGFDASTTLYKPLLNSSSGNTWVPGDLNKPMLPEFTAADLLVVGAKFGNGGTLLWQQGVVTGVDISLDTMVVPHGTTIDVEYTINPSSAPDTHTTWESSDTTVVEITGEGQIKGVGAGTATVTVTTRDGGHTDTVTVTVEDYNKITDVSVTAAEMTLPTANDSADRPLVNIGEILTISVDILPLDADYQNYTITTSNSRATVDGNVVSFVYGDTGPGKVSVYVTFEDSSIGELNFRFETQQPAVAIPITSVVVTATEFTLPTVNDAEVRMDVPVGSTATINVTDILPADATNKAFTITTSNSRATVEGNVVTFGEGTSGAGKVSIYVTFEDSAIGELNYRFTTFVPISITNVTVTATEFTLPNANDSVDRMDVTIGDIATINVTDILPIDATNQNYTVTTSNSRATVEGNVVTFVYGNTGPGKVSIYVTFEDPAIGELNYRFTTLPAEVVITTPITGVTVTATEFTLPAANDSADRMEVTIGDTATINVTEILPLDASNQNYTVTTSNSRATVDANVVTFVYGDTGPGSVSIYVTFEDPAIGQLNYRFTTKAAVTTGVSITGVTVTAAEFVLPNVNDSADRMAVAVGSTATINVTEILPLDASNQNYTITTSNSRATIVGNVVTFGEGTSGAGSVSILVTFEDPAIGELNYRFSTFVPVSVTSVTVTATELTLPNANDSADRMNVTIGDTATINVTEILPLDATNQNYTVTTSNSRATVDGNVVTFVYGNTGPGSVSILVTFEDPAIGELNFRFTTNEATN